MTPRTRDGLRELMRFVCEDWKTATTEWAPDVLTWIKRQLEIDEQRRQKRGKYRKFVG